MFKTFLIGVCVGVTGVLFGVAMASATVTIAFIRVMAAQGLN